MDKTGENKEAGAEDSNGGGDGSREPAPETAPASRAELLKLLRPGRECRPQFLKN